MVLQMDAIRQVYVVAEMVANGAILVLEMIADSTAVIFKKISADRPGHDQRLIESS